MTEQFVTMGEALALIEDLRQVRDEYVLEDSKCNSNLRGVFQKGNEAIKQIDTRLTSKWGGVKYGEILDLFFAIEQESKKYFAKAKNNESTKGKQKVINDKIQAIGQRVGQYIELINVVGGFGALGEQFKNKGYKIINVEKRVPLVDENGKKHSDIDLFLESIEVCILIEFKLTLKKRYVQQYIEKLATYRPGIDTKGKKLIAAVAGVRMTKSVKDYAHNEKLYVLVHDGDHCNIAPTPEKFKPKEW